MTRLQNALAATVAATVGIFGAAPAFAQMDPVIMGQGQVLSSMSRGYAERGGVRDDGETRGASQRSARICAQAPQVRARLGAKNPRYLELVRACRRAGL